MSIRRQRQELANLRALEEEEDRMEMRGSGGVPSMGVSQFRGGAKKSGRRRRRAQYYDEEMEGGFLGALAGLAARALPSIISGVSRIIPSAARIGSTVARPVAQVAARAPSTAIVPYNAAAAAARTGTQLATRTPGVVGRVLPSVARPATTAATTASRVGTTAASTGSRLGTVASRLGTAANVALPAYMAYDYLTSKPSAPSGDAGYYDQYGDGGMLPGGMAAPNVAPPPSRRTRGDANVANVVGSGRADGRSARAAVVRKVMREMGMSLPEASRYVKQNGLY